MTVTTNPQRTGRGARYAVDAAGNVTGLSNSGYALGLAGFVPATNDSAGILAAKNAAIANGGGMVQLLAVTYTLTSPIVVASNVVYVGQAYGYDDYSSGTRGGTILTGDGTFNAFEYNPTDLGAPPSSAALKASEIFGAGIKCLSIKNCLNGIKIGALYNGGCNNLMIDNVYAMGCAEWGIWLENCGSMAVGTIAVMGNAVGNLYIGSSGNGWNYGEGHVAKIYCQAGVSGTGMLGNIKSRGIVIEARGTGSALNDMHFGLIGVNGWAGAAYTYLSAITLNVTAIPVDDLSKLAVGGGITFSSTLGNITGGNCAYFVLSKSAATGAGSITISDQKGGTVITPSTSGNRTLTCKGGSLLEIGGNNYLGAGNVVTASTLSSSDVEQCGTVGMLLQNTVGGNFHLNSSTTNIGVCMRTFNQYNTLHIESSSVVLDADSNSRKCKLFGTKPLTVRGSMGGGLTWNDTVDGMGLNLSCVGDGTPDLYGGDSSGFVSLNLNTPIAFAHQQQPSGTAFYSSAPQQNSGQVITYSGAGDGSFTLPTLAYVYQMGLPFYISNPSAGILTVNTAASQTIDNVGAATSFTMAANTTAIVMGQKVGSTYFWARYK